MSITEEAATILATARSRETLRETARVPIDYRAAQREFVQQKTALTRAVNSGSRDRVLIACQKAVRAWEQPGRAWPDDWSRWQRALDDTFPVFQAPDLNDLR